MKSRYNLMMIFALLLNMGSSLVFANEIKIGDKQEGLGSPSITETSSKEDQNLEENSVVAENESKSSEDAEEKPSISSEKQILDNRESSSEQIKPDIQQPDVIDKQIASTETEKTSAYATVADLPGAFQPSVNGSYLLFPLRVGIVSQPQEEQYIVQGTNASMSIQTTSWVNSFGRVSADVNGWQQQTDGTWKSLGKIGTFNSPASGVLGSTLQSVNIPISGLKTGNYYFQVVTNLNRVVLIGSPAPYYSRLGMVTVKDKPTPALGITATTPKVVFEKANYSGKAVTNSVDSTSKITWSSSLANLTFLKAEGRSIDFNIANQGDVINKDIQAPGIPFSITATATNSDNTAVKSDQTVYLGGLQAKNVTEDSGFSWKIDDQGLADLNKSVSGATSWNYEWKYFDGATVKSFSTTDGANNYKGTVTNLTSLNTATNLLTFDKNSKFMTAARLASDKGAPYAVQVFFSTTIDTGEGKTETINISSNKAQLLVTKTIGTLVLDQVPSFNFQQLPASFIYDGTQGREPSAKGNLQVTDTRQQGGWQLSAKATRFKSTNNQNLKSNSRIKMTGLPIDSNLNDDNLSKTIVSSSKSETFALTGFLLLQPSPNALLVKGDKFSSTITWTLISTTATPPPA